MILSNSFISIWFCIALAFSFFGVAGGGYLVLTQLKQRFFESVEQVEIKMLREQLTFIQKENDELKVLQSQFIKLMLSENLKK